MVGHGEVIFVIGIGKLLYDSSYRKRINYNSTCSLI